MYSSICKKDQNSISISSYYYNDDIKVIHYYEYDIIHNVFSMQIYTINQYIEYMKHNNGRQASKLPCTTMFRLLHNETLPISNIYLNPSL